MVTAISSPIDEFVPDAGRTDTLVTTGGVVSLGANVGLGVGAGVGPGVGVGVGAGVEVGNRVGVDGTGVGVYVGSGLGVGAGVAVGVGQVGVAFGNSVFQETDVNIDSLIQRVREVEFDYGEDHLARNPTHPILGGSKYLLQLAADRAATATPEDLLYAANRKELTGILWNEKSPLAVIDNEVVYVGFRFLEPIEVKAIEPTRIVLTIDGQDVEIVKELGVSEDFHEAIDLLRGRGPAR